MKDVRKGRSTSETQNSLYTLEIESSKCSYQWREVSINYINAHVPWNMPIKALRTTSRTFAFRQVKSAGEAAAARDGKQRVGNGDGNRDRDDGNMDDMTSGGSIDSIRVKAAQLATESQHMRYSQRTQDQDLPVLPGPPIHCAECPNRPVRRQWQCGRIKFEPIKVNPPPEVEMTYQQCARAAQPHRDASKCRYAVHTPGHQRRKLKIKRLNDKKSA